MKVAIDKAVAQAILTYLSKMPYGEVFNLIPHLVQAQLIDEKPGAAKEPAALESAKGKVKAVPAKEPAVIEAAKAALKKQLEEASAEDEAERQE